MGYLSHRVDPDELKPGDHIYTWRTAFTYAHHGFAGIYVGGNKVIHFTCDQENAKSNSGWNLSSSLPLPSSCLNSSSLNSSCLNSSCLNSSCLNSSSLNSSSLNSSCLNSSSLNSSCLNSSSLNSSCLNSSCLNSSCLNSSCLNSSCLNSSCLNSSSLNSSSLNSIDCGFSLPNCDSGLCLCTYYCGFHLPESGVTSSCLNCFIGTGSLYLYQYGVNKWRHLSKLRGGTSTTAPCDPPQVVIHRAMCLFNSQAGFGKYDVYTNNCEDFALYCKTGLLIPVKRVTGSSGQVNFIYNAPWKTALVSVALKVVCGTVAGAVGGGYTVGKHYMNRYKYDIGVRNDVVKVKVEDVGSFRGC
ncbi:putative LRAT-like domain-containing protein [Helianthus annuus]|uniref:LRAT-like domain-containing protein n=1 Tax=Helianthus annuus TaxID=4232 RepID=A0A9K3JK31_HELAN|nr:putative LRAT-like domain-containing protein [Helianthus annuus]KAJ0602442.1 putative LRAT domain-containing protein [Helianthus annuus]KAJ0945175.1 putative LRAT-like domain-containing protein [Helianthus annuus]